jgi:polyhydroxyalkanoate synthesis regulator protein
VADQKKLSGVLTQAQLDAEALYAAAAGINPAQAELIKKNAQGNIMSPGVLQSLSALGVDAKSGVASSIANIDASTREQRLANQKDVAAKRESEAFKNTKRGQAWQAIKFGARGIVTAFSAIPQFVDATYRTTLDEVKKRGVVSGITSGLGINPFISGEEQAKIAEKTFEQTQYGQIAIKSIADAKKGKFPDIQMGEGFFASEEIGIGHAARQASLGAAKIAIRNDEGKLLGYRPRTFFGDTFSNVFTLGNPETVAGANIALAADIVGSFFLDPGIAKGQQVKQLRKLAEQQQASGALKAAAETMKRLSDIEEVEKQVLESAKALRTQADAVNKIDADTFATRARDARAAATGKAEDTIKSSVSVRVAQARLDEISAQKAQLIEKSNAATESRKALEEAMKAPKIVERTQNAIVKQTKQLDQMKLEISDAIAAGRIPMYTADDLDNLQASIKALEEKLSTAKGLVPENPVTPDALIAAKELEKKSRAFVKEAAEAEKFSIKQVAERSRTQRAMESLNERALREAAKAKKAERTLSEKLSDATLSLKDKRKAWEIDVQRLANINQTAERPEFAYQAIADFLTNGHGTAAVDKLVELTDWKQIWRKADGKISHDVARALADATTPDDVVDILSPYLLKGDIQGGILKPGLLARRGEAITQRTKFIQPPVRALQGVGARVQSRLLEHEKFANLFSAFNNGAEVVARAARRSYQTKVKAGSIVNIHDREELLRATEDFGVASKLDKKVLDEIIDEIADAASASVAGYAASVKLMKAVFAQYGEKIPAHMQDSFKSYTTAFENSSEQMSSYWAKRHVAGNAKLEYITLKGEGVVLPGPHLSSELLNSTVYFPPVSELLRLTSKLSKIKTVAKAEDIADTLISNYWKKLVLVRPAYIIRNIAEEQIRVAATGHISFFNNPGMALAMWLGRDEGKSWRKVLRQFDTYRHTVFDEAFSTGDDALDILDETLGHNVKNSYVDMMNSAATGLDASNFKVLQFQNIGPVAFGSPRFFDGIANQMRMLNSDVFSRVVAGFDTPQIKAAMAKGQFRQDAVVDYFLHGAGRKDLDAFAESTPQKFKAFIKTPEGLRNYLYTGKSPKGEDISILARITETTGGNKSLMEMIAKGKVSIGGAEFKIPRPVDGAVNSISNSKAMKAGKKALLEEQSKFAKQLKDTFSDAGNWDNVVVNVPSKNIVLQEDKKNLFEFVDKFFDKATEFEKNTTFGPEFRQAYWDAINRIAKSLDSDAKAKLLAAAQDSLTPLQKAGKPVGSKHPVWSAFKSADGNGPLSLEDAHAYADNYARKHVKELFYNAQEKRLIFHQLRLIAPFAAAWENTISKWAELGMENPLQVYKAVKGLQWAQDPESSAIYLMTDAEDYYDPNQGFFFTNPDSGQRQFFVPFAGTVMASLAKKVTGANYNGAPIAFTANPMSFNFAFGTGTMLPGVGPGVTLPLSALSTFNNNMIDNMPMGIQKWLFPFGRADFSGGLQSAILPGNWNKILGFATGAENTYASNFKPVMNYLASGGNYNLDNPDDQARLVADTDTFSRWESVMRGVVGLVSPVSLIQNGLAKDKDGDTTLQAALLEDFQTIFQNNDGDYNKTWYDFLNLYGASQAFALISASAGNGPSNWDSYNFVVSNPDVASKYKDVWGYVMPGGGLSTEMYQWNIIHGTKNKLSPQEILDKVNNQRYYAARDALMTRVDAGELDKDGYRTALQTLKDAMGGGPVAEFDPNKRGRVISQLETLIQDERFVDAPSIVALRDYMAMRQTALDNLGKKTFTGAKSEQAERDWLAAQAEWVIEANPDFQKMFYAFFANELEGK